MTISVYFTLFFVLAVHSSTGRRIERLIGKGVNLKPHDFEARLLAYADKEGHVKRDSDEGEEVLVGNSYVPPRLRDARLLLKDEPPRRKDEPPRQNKEPKQQKDVPPRKYGVKFRFEDEPPRRNDEPPRGNDEPPRRNDEPPRRNDEPPRRNDEPPRRNDKPPRRNDEPPRRNDEPPRQNDEPPRQNDEPPRQNDEPPRQNDEPPRQNDEPPRQNDEPPRQNDEPPRRNDEPPRRNDEPPRQNDEPPRQNDEPPRHNDEPPRQNDKPPRRNDEPLRRNDEPPRQNDEPPRQNDEPPRQNDEPPRQNDEPPRQNDEPPRSISHRINYNHLHNYLSPEKRSSEDYHDLSVQDKMGQIENYEQFRMLDDLDDVMAQEEAVVGSKQASACVEAKLNFCGDVIHYPITKAQKSIHSFYDGLVEAGLDLMTIQTEGAVASCKKELKNVLCKDRFPRCAGRTVTWGKLRDECSKAIESCPQKVRDSLQNIDLCRKLGNGDAPADRCYPPVRGPDNNNCELNRDSQVAPWDKHSAIEVHNLIEMQKTLFNIPENCVKGLSSYLCLPAKTCYKLDNTAKLKADFNRLCLEALNSCKNTTLSKGMQMFFQCQ